MKKVMSPSARARISKAQKARWRAYHAVKNMEQFAKDNSSPDQELIAKAPNVVTQQPIQFFHRPAYYAEAFKFLVERIKNYDSAIEAYVEGFVAGYKAAASTKEN